MYVCYSLLFAILRRVTDYGAATVTSGKLCQLIVKITTLYFSGGSKVQGGKLRPMWSSKLKYRCRTFLSIEMLSQHT